MVLFRRFSGIYEPFPSHQVLGQFFLDSVLPCAATPADASLSSASLDEADASHLEKVRELVKAAAAGLKVEGDGTKWSRFGNVGGPGKSVNPKSVNRLDSVEVCGTLGHEACDIFFVS